MSTALGGDSAVNLEEEEVQSIPRPPSQTQLSELEARVLADSEVEWAPVPPEGMPSQLHAPFPARQADRSKRRQTRHVLQSVVPVNLAALAAEAAVSEAPAPAPAAPTAPPVPPSPPAPSLPLHYPRSCQTPAQSSPASSVASSPNRSSDSESGQQVEPLELKQSLQPEEPTQEVEDQTATVNLAKCPSLVSLPEEERSLSSTPRPTFPVQRQTRLASPVSGGPPLKVDTGTQTCVLLASATRRTLAPRRRAKLAMPEANEPPKSPERRSFTETVASRVLQACQRTDADSKITYVGRDDDGRTVVRVRGGCSSSVVALQKALRSLMPFARVRTSEDVLDGSVQATIVVPTAADEWSIAQSNASGSKLSRFLHLSSFAMGLIGLGMWAATFANADGKEI